MKENSSTKKKHIWPKVLCIILASIILFVSVLFVTVSGLWFNEISTVASFTHLVDRKDRNDEGSVYKMDVYGGYYFDKFLEQGGAKNDKELINFITNSITKGVIDMTISETDIGCSSFTAKIEGDNGDEYLFARNYDFDKTNVCLTFCDPGNGRYKSFSTVDLAYVGMDVDTDVTGLMDKITCLAAPYAPLDGVNEKGVACGIYMSYQGDVDAENTTVATDQNDPNKNNITSTTMLRLVLDYADSVDKAVELIKEYNLHDSANTSFHYMIADATGKSAILEWVATGTNSDTDRDGTKRELKVYYSDSDNALGENETAHDYQVITNFILTPNYYDGVDTTRKHGVDRYNEIWSQLNPTNGVVENEQKAMDILAKVGRRGWTDANSGKTGVTVHSAVYNLTKKTVLWVANEHYNDTDHYFEYDLTTGKLTQLSK